MTVFEHVNWSEFFQVKTFADFGAWSFLFIDLQDDCAGELSMIYFTRGVAALCRRAEIYRTFSPEMQTWYIIQSVLTGLNILVLNKSHIGKIHHNRGFSEPICANGQINDSNQHPASANNESFYWKVQPDNQANYKPNGRW